MDLKSLFKKKSKQAGEPKSYDSLHSEFDRADATVDESQSNYDITRNDSIDLEAASLSEETKGGFQSNTFGKKGNNSPFESLLKKTEESKEDNFGFSSKIDVDPKVPHADKDYGNEEFSRAMEKDEQHTESTEITVNPLSINQRSSSSADVTTDSNFEAKQKRLPLIGHLPPKTQYRVAGLLATIGLFSFAYGAFLYTDASNQQAKSLESMSTLQAESQKLDNNFSTTILGKEGAFDELTKQWPIFNAEYDRTMQLTDKMTGAERSRVQNSIKTNVDQIKANYETVNKSSEFLKNTSSRVNSINTELRHISLMLNRLGMQYVQLGANQTEMAAIYYLKTTLQTISESTIQILLTEDVNPQTLPNLIKARQGFRAMLNDIYKGNVSKGISPVPNGIAMDAYQELAKTWVHFADQVVTLSSRGNDLIKIRALGGITSKIIVDLDKNIALAKDVANNNDFGGLSTGRILVTLAIALLLMAALLMFLVYTFEKDNRSLLEKLENNRTQSSIFRLLNEMSPIQDGDLTQKTTVTEEITGTIADAINSTVGSLALLVRKIKDTSFAMRQKTNEVNVISLEMLKSNEEQASSILGTGQDVIKITDSINQISKKTRESSQVAQNSVNVSEEGSQQVMASLLSMKEINNNMNETVHLMKNVIDASKQISDIVVVLSDIAEDTAILALNATVQAAKAGEHGKGFKIVADEIQELADSSGEKSRMVGALIASVQTSIQAVENAVSKTTQEVAKGVELSEKAGESLNQITEVSYDLAAIVRAISEDAQKNAAISQQVSKNMTEILDKTEQTKQSTQKTAYSISEISNLSNELGNSVQTFKVD